MDMQNISVAKLEIFNQHYTPIVDLKQLHLYLQNAVTLEFATIPAYTTAMYSMKDKSGMAYHLTASVVMEEMFHVYQAANLLVAVGGIPYFTGKYTPQYPTFIPNADKKATPYISLRGATTALYQDVFMAIETPSAYESPPENENIQTIGQFYKAIEDGIVYLERKAQAKGGTIFCNTSGYDQHQDYYFGKGGGRIINVVDLDSAKSAIQQIIQQGEGAVEPGKTLVPNQSWGAYNHYGKRVDGQYGPVIGSPTELSHYFKFKDIADGHVALPEIYPVVAVPVIDNYKNSRAQDLARAFNIAYSELLRCIEASFQAGEAGRNPYFQKAVKLMHHELPKLADALMNTCIWSDGDNSVGPNALPTWEYTEQSIKAARSLIAGIMDDLQQEESPEKQLAAFAAIDVTLQEIETTPA